MKSSTNNKKDKSRQDQKTNLQIFGEKFFIEDEKATEYLSVLKGNAAYLNGKRHINEFEIIDLSVNRSILIIRARMTFKKEAFYDKDSLQISLIGQRIDLEDNSEVDDLDHENNREIHLSPVEINVDKLYTSVNLNKIEGDKPLEMGEYSLFLKISYNDMKMNSYVVYKPLGNIKEYLPDGFYNTKLEYYTGRRQLEYNLMFKYDISNNTLLLSNKKVKDINPSLIYGDIKNKAEKHSIFYKILVRILFRFFFKAFCLFPIKRNKILFASDSRDELGGNFEYLYYELEKRGLNTDLSQIFKENNFVRKSFQEVVKFAYDCATSEYIFIEENHQMISQLKLKKDTELVQLWHAAGAFKKFGYSRLGLPGGPKLNSKDHKNYTKAMVSSSNLISIYAESFGIEPEKVYPYGLPRADVFFNEELMVKKRTKLYKEYNFLKGKKIILFAPTFRGGTRKSAHYPFEHLNLKKIYDDLYSEDYIFIFKVHFNTLNKITIPYEYSDFFYDMTDYRDINDLFLITDVLITDYSSVCFEFSLLNKPMLFFSPDVEGYISERGFYFDYQDLIPGKLVRNSDEMTSAILKKDFEFQKVCKFRDYFFEFQDGNSAQRIVEEVILNKGNDHISENAI